MADPDTFRVSPSLQGMPGVSAPPVESATPGLLVRAGETIQRAAGVGSDIYQRELREQNATRVTEALTALTEYQHELTYGVDGDDSGWATQMGKNALERPNQMALDEEYGSQFEQRIESLSLGLGNEAQRKLFRDRAAAMNVDLRGRVQQHVARQGAQYRQDTLSGVVVSGQRLMGTATDPIDMARAADMTRQAAAQLADMRGLPDEAREDFYREMLTPGHLGALSRMQSLEDVDGAEAYFNEHRDELTYDATVKIEAGLLEQRAIMEGREIGEAIAAGSAQAAEAAGPQEVGMPVAGAASYTRTGRFGENRGTHRHSGVDWAMPVGTPVYAGAAGTVRVKPNNGAYGNTVEVVLDNGTVLRMAHLSGFEVEDGQRVGKGQPIARSGNTGRSTGPHLHYEVIGADGAKVDPLEWHQGRPKVSGGGGGSMPSTRAAALENLRQRDLPPRQHAEAERAINSYFSAQREAEAEQKDAILSRAYAEIDSRGSLSPATRSAIVGADLGSAIPSLRSFEEATQDRREGKTIGEADGLVAYGTAREMIADGRINDVGDLLQLKPYLPDNYFKQLVDDVTSSPQTARQRADSVISLMNEEIEGSGLFVDENGKKTTETRREYSRFVGAVTRQIEREQEVTGRPVPTDRQRQIVLGMVGQQVISATGERVAGYQIRQQYDAIPAPVRARAVRSLQRQGIPVPSQRQVVSTVLRMQGQ